VTAMLYFPDVEAMTRQYLLDKLAEIYPALHVATTVPPTLDWTTNPWLVVITVAGSGTEMGRVYQNVLLGFDCYAPTEIEASELVRDVQAHIGHWQYETGRIAAYSTNAFPTLVPDDDTGYPHYWHSANVAVKATNEKEQ
jgi:hypothetical protein